jgi:hypothetical protein
MEPCKCILIYYTNMHLRAYYYALASRKIAEVSFDFYDDLK